LSGVLPIGPVYDVAQALDNPFAAASGMIQTVPHPGKDDLRVLASPIKVNGERATLAVAPKLGEGNEELLADGKGVAKVQRS
jgi:crotonobetainyl-CoA:carnitine CoA-transferase CaiB-like acyl-CoA transferase